MSTLPVFYYPSTIMWVDDDSLFLNAASQMFGKEYSIQTFNDPKDCIHFFEKYTPPLSKIPFLRGSVENEYYDTVDHSPVDFNVTRLYQLHQQPERNQEISVIVVDYGMPEMNGIELCRELRKFPMKKILLTGEADHRDAVAAFNDNTIDRFVRKDSASLAGDIELYVSTLSLQYFRERTLTLLSHLEVAQGTPLSDPTFVGFFQDYCRMNNIREYSLIDKVGSFLLINKDNQHSFLILHTDNSLNTFVELHDDVKEAEPILNEIKQRKKIPFFGVGKESWKFKIAEWSQHLHSPTILVGREKYYWASIKNSMYNALPNVVNTHEIGCG